MPRSPASLLALLALPAPAAADADSGVETVLVTGASGQTGSILYKKLQADPAFRVRGLVLNRTRANGTLGCGACGEAEGIYEGDVRDAPAGGGAAGLAAAVAGADRVVILTGVRGSPPDWAYPPGLCPVDVDYRGAVNQVTAAREAGVGHVLFVSTGMTQHPNVPFLDDMKCPPRGTTPDWPAPWAPGTPGVPAGGQALFYKLNAEAHLMAASRGRRPFNFTIVKPMMLPVVSDDPDVVGKARFVVSPWAGDEVSPAQGESGGWPCGFDGCPSKGACWQMQRADLADVIHQALRMPALSSGLRFLVSADTSRPRVDDFAGLFANATM